MSQRIAVLGSGAMGTACAMLLCERDDVQVRMWVRQPDVAAQMQASRENARLLPGIKLPERLELTADIAAATADADYLLAAIPTQYLRPTLKDIAAQLPANLPIISVVKGIENESFQRPSQILGELFRTDRVVAVSGPSHAEEVAQRLPATVVAAGMDPGLTREVQSLLSTDRFRVYTNSDMVGVELAGALKNVVAIAAGISDGLGFGDNAKAALMTRALVEMARFGRNLGAETTTFAGLAGMGDLITTCVSPYGRNRRVGRLLGEGRQLASILQELHGVAEGVATAKSVHAIAQSRQIDMPITAEVHAVLFEGKCPRQATNDLMLRPPREE